MTEYTVAYTAMTLFNAKRQPDSIDELWCVQHLPVYTLGLAGRTEHILQRSEIPVIETDRGGQVTYHGPGQLIVYLLIDLKRKGLMVKQYVSLIEQSMIAMCSTLGLTAIRKNGAPGVYIGGKKLAALGIRIKQGCTYHGLALNVDMDLAPFREIDPCGYPGLQVTQLADEGCQIDIDEAFNCLLPWLLKTLGYSYTEYPQHRESLSSINTYLAA
jgi:lipoyl(octanoyl) transferase